jgi:hypothetical protein
VKATASDTIRRVKDATDLQSWWVEPRYKGHVFPRYRVDLKLSAYCKITDPTDCAADGTVLFREDFGGNDISI